MSDTSNLNNIVNYFIQIYPEFEPLTQTSEGLTNIETMLNKVACIYPEYSQVLNSTTQNCKMLPFFMLVAHYLVMGGYAVSIGLQPSKGIVSSSNIDSVSISFQSSPYNNIFSYFLGQTKYGQEYLAYIARQTGIRYFK